MKKLKKQMQKVLKVLKQVNNFVSKTIKNFKQMKTNIKKILAVTIIAVCMCACGSTKVMVDKPAQGTQTTITVTTNNPITTEVKPDTQFLNK